MIFIGGVCDDEILFMVVCKDVCCQVLPRGIWYISGKHRLDCLLGLMLGIDLTMINIIGNVGIYSGPVEGGLGEVCHFLYTSVVVVEITEHPFIQLRGYAHFFSL